MLETFETFRSLLHHEYPCHLGVIIDDGEEVPCPS